MKKILLLAAIIGAVVTAAAFIFLLQQNPAKESSPSGWFYAEGRGYVLDVFKATEGRARYTDEGIDYKEGEYDTLFTFESFYRGIPFTEFYGDRKGGMAVSPYFVPDDGILNAFIMEKRIDGQWHAYFFVDEDWKREHPDTIIYYGTAYEFEKRFEFGQVADGIYYDEIIDVERIKGNVHSMGPLIGDITREDQINKTVVRII